MFVGDGRHPLDRQFHIGRFFGIPLYFHIFLVIFLAVEVLSSVFSGHFLRIAWPFLLMFSVYLHELGHALSSASFGAKPRRIVLHLFGGVAEVPGGLSRRQELWVIAWGPLVSLFLAVGGYFLGWVPIPWLAWMGRMLFFINSVLFLFNILPIFPLDGGQFLRGFLSLRIGPHEAIRRSLPWSMLLLLLLGVFALATGQFFMLIISAVVLMVNYAEWQRWQHLFGGRFWSYLWPFGAKKKPLYDDRDKVPDATVKEGFLSDLHDRYLVWRYRKQAELLMRRADEEGIHKLDPHDRKLLEMYLDAKLRLRRTSIKNHDIH